MDAHDPRTVVRTTRTSAPPAPDPAWSHPAPGEPRWPAALGVPSRRHGPSPHGGTGCPLIQWLPSASTVSSSGRRRRHRPHPPQV